MQSLVNEHEVIIHPVDPEMSDQEIKITHIDPIDDLKEVDDDEKDYGILMNAGSVIGILQFSI